MLLHQITTNITLFLIGFIGVTTNYNNVLISLVGIELMLLSANLNFIFFSIYYDDLYGQIFSLFILTIAAAESAIGLAILVVSYKIKGTLFMNDTSSFKG